MEQVIRVPRWFMQISKTLEIFLGYVFFPQVFFSIGAVLISTEVILYYIMEFLGNLPKIFSVFFFFATALWISVKIVCNILYFIIEHASRHEL